MHYGSYYQPGEEQSSEERTAAHTNYALTISPTGCHHHYLGETMIFFGVLGTIIIWIGTVSRDHGRGGSRR